LILSALQPETVAARLQSADDRKQETEQELEVPGQ